MSAFFAGSARGRVHLGLGGATTCTLGVTAPKVEVERCVCCTLGRYLRSLPKEPNASERILSFVKFYGFTYEHINLCVDERGEKLQFIIRQLDQRQRQFLGKNPFVPGFAAQYASSTPAP